MQNTHPSQMIYTPMELFGTVIEPISGYSLYRSIQKPLKRVFAHPLLKEIDSDLLREKSEDERLWGRFKKGGPRTNCNPIRL
ncbi:hypothetical protein BT96DRAFT_925713 [Gymnopus androsaceus JB14]|uniref:Uncharacterized protein n=1 Tax=Gymnopus androsaceus JB14 TaxID=1447944 RepID=A0A6A4H056_9AGAR|nr:hypothetical protein BT96DRAFT_925713 [Gymnopus androsaceus JB14]